MTSKTTLHTIGTLAGMAECAHPDSPTSAGTLFLLAVEATIPDALQDIADGKDVNDVIFEIGQHAPDWNSFRRWHEFVDLAAWQEDISEWGAPEVENLTDSVAGIALGQIAERLARALIEEAQGAAYGRALIEQAQGTADDGG